MLPIHKGILNSWGGISMLAGTALAACSIGMAGLPSLRGSGVTSFLAYFGLASLAYGTAVLRLERDRLPLAMIWIFALLMRLPLLFTTPTLSDDIYRYLWDGHLLNLGVNPYAHPVDSAALLAYDIPLRSLVNHNWMASPYLPTAQLYFGLVTRLAPQHPLAFQIAATALDLATGWLVMDLLARLGLPRRRALIYLWNPLIAVESAHGAHVDFWMLFLLVLAFWLLVIQPARVGGPNRKPGKIFARVSWPSVASALALGAATLTKGLPALTAPLFLRRWGWRGALVYALLVGSASALFAAGAGWGLSGPLDGRGVFGAARIYAQSWNYNSGLYHWLETGLSGYRSAGAVPAEPAYADAIRLAKMIIFSLLTGATLSGGLLAYRMDVPATGDLRQRTLVLLRLATLPLGASILLTTTVHPWYAAVIVPFLLFLWPAPGDPLPLQRLAWPWLYFTCALSLSYITYIDPDNLREFDWVRWVEYIPFYLWLAWGIGSLLWQKYSRK